MFEQATFGERKNALSDWLLRGAIGAIFILEGADKFGAGSGWVKLFQEIGFGQWFRYLTGVVELVGGVLVLIPRTVTAGLTLLACTMGSAALLLAFRVGRPQDSVFSAALLVCLIAVLWNRWARS